MDTSDDVRTVLVQQAAPTSRSCLDTHVVTTSPPLLQNYQEINRNNINKEENYEHFRIGKKNGKRRLDEVNEENNQTQTGKSKKSEKDQNQSLNED